ncbi:MAG TPA: alpha/beta hydrolase [Acidimicrobiales bacterium]|jgi:pimeloyl-ACP methyl ester carboxylesterase|nr:alpha/beta hydrolase [Acidimicrobiales bacterium]
MPNIAANGIQIEYETFGDSTNPPLLLIMGLGAQMILWDEEFCEQIAARGFYVIRFDNRDAGLSTHFHDAPLPDLPAAMTGDSSSASYTLSDMAADAAGLLDALGLSAAHIVGASMGGMIAQSFAIEHPDKTLSLCSIMSTTGDTAVGQPDPEALEMLMATPPQTVEEAADTAILAAKIIGGKRYPVDEERVRARAVEGWNRDHDALGFGRQLVGIMASGDRTPGLAGVRVPTLVIHGLDDPLVTPSGGESTAKAVPGARLLNVEGMGHDLPIPLWPGIIDAIVENAEKAGSPA